MKKTGYRKTIAGKVSQKIFFILIFLCICLSAGIQNAFNRELSAAEVLYMQEVIARISAEVNGELNHYIDATVTTAKSHTIQDYLLNVEEGIQEDDEIFLEKGNALTDFQKIKGYDYALEEIQGIHKVLGDSVLYVVVCSIDRDNFFNSGSLEGSADFSLKDRPFYEAYTTQKTYITDPYEEVLTGLTIITIAEPIFDENGRVIGIFLIQLSLDNLGNMVTSSTFGETGASMLMDRNNNIIAYNNPEVVGMNVSQLNFSGDITTKELENPTGIIDEYDFGGAKRTGGIVTISELSGWKILLAMDSSEFKSNISVVALRLNFALVLCVIGASIACAVIVYRSLAPMKKLGEFMEELSQGKLGGQVDYDEENEIGKLAQLMNQMATNLASYINMVDIALISLGKGDLTPPENVVFHGDFLKLETSLSTFAERMSASLTEIKVSMEQMTQGSEQVSTGAQLLSSGSSEQTSSVEGLNHLIQSINESIVITAKNSSSVTSDAEHISNNLLISNEKMQQLVISIQDIRAMSDEVKRIIKSIEDVAFQTNILSLNASVEAARAGTAGRGFAVVADQVRILSASTAEAAEQTTKIINDIANAIEIGTELAQTTSKELQSVVDEVDVFVGNISNISLSAQGQADAIAEINQGIDDITKVVTQNSAISQESAASSEELSSQATQIYELVNRYKLTEKNKFS
ncbi:MAG: methyl-accepting chemotaxis protein [Eubacteriales bacterium]